MLYPLHQIPGNYTGKKVAVKNLNSSFSAWLIFRESNLNVYWKLYSFHDIIDKLHQYQCIYCVLDYNPSSKIYIGPNHILEKS